MKVSTIEEGHSVKNMRLDALMVSENVNKFRNVGLKAEVSGDLAKDRDICMNILMRKFFLCQYI